MDAALARPVGVVLNIQPKPGNTFWAKRTTSCWPALVDGELCGCRFQIGLGTFFQVHHQQAESLVDAHAASGNCKREVLAMPIAVWDLGLPLLQEGVRLIDRAARQH